MQQRRDLPPTLLDRAADQGHVLTTSQLNAAGLSPRVIARLAKAGQLVPVFRGAYRVGGAPEQPAGHTRRRPHPGDVFAGWDLETRTQIWAAHLLVPGSKLGGWHTLALFRASVDAERLRTIVLWTPGRGRAPRGRCAYIQDQLRRLEFTPMFPGCPPTINPVDALLDVVNDLDERDATAVALEAMRDAAPAHAVAHFLRLRGRQRHRGLLTDLTRAATSGVESILENHFIRRVARPHGLPRATHQHPLPSGRADVWYAQFRLAVELDGDAFHDPRRDRERDNINAAQGIETRRFGWNDVIGQPCTTARRIAQVLNRRGWTGSITPCPQCPQAE